MSPRRGDASVGVLQRLKTFLPMTSIEWRKEFCTGIDGVDFEHEQLIKQLNAVLELLANDAEPGLVIDGLGDIYGSISAHFALEEQTMQKRGYDRYAEHKADHERLLDDIRDLADEYERSADLDAQRFGERLANWFQNHFQTHDARLHRLVGTDVHQPESDSAMRAMIRNAKNKMLGKRD